MPRTPQSDPSGLSLHPESSASTAFAVGALVVSLFVASLQLLLLWKAHRRRRLARSNASSSTVPGPELASASGSSRRASFAVKYENSWDQSRLRNTQSHREEHDDLPEWSDAAFNARERPAKLLPQRSLGDQKKTTWEGRKVRSLDGNDYIDPQPLPLPQGMPGVEGMRPLSDALQRPSVCTAFKDKYGDTLATGTSAAVRTLGSSSSSAIADEEPSVLPGPHSDGTLGGGSFASRRQLAAGVSHIGDNDAAVRI